MLSRLTLLLFLFSASLRLSAQNIDLMMQAWYWDYFQNGNYGSWISNLNNNATQLELAGFKHIWLPPLSRSSTTNNVSNGYNPMDLYDLGQYGPECAWGSRTELDALISNFNTHNLSVVSDMIYNHRDGGRPEKNTAVQYFITNTSNTVVYPSDRFLCVLPLGSANPGNNGAGEYYFKVKSRSNGYAGSGYKFYARTRTTSYQGSINETEPNGGGDCTQASQNAPLGTDIVSALDASGCRIDEFKVTLTSGSFNATDDTLFIYLNNTGGYSDHYVFGLWSQSRMANIVGELEYWTYTNFNTMPSGQGGMNYNNFRPNDNTSNAGGISETLGCDWNCPLFFYDYDQAQQNTNDVLNAWTKWEMDQGIDGLRMDAVKHFDPAFTGQLLTYLYNNSSIPDMVVGESFDYNATTLLNWVNAVYSNMSTAARGAIKVRVFDFALRGALKGACDTYGYDVRTVFNSGVVQGAGGSGFNTVTFVDNHDIRHEGNGIQNDANLAYAYMLTNNQLGAPCVFYPDYYGVQVGNTPLIDLQDEINNLVYLHQQYIFGSSNTDNLSRAGTPYGQYFVPNGNNGIPQTTLIYQLRPNSSNKNVIVAINFSGNPLDVYQKINTGWGAGNGTTFTDMLGFSSTTTTNITNNSEIHVLLPGRSYTVYVQGINTPLPVTLLDFEARPEQETVLLHWLSETEKDFSGYEVERSVREATRFETIGQVAGKNSTEKSAYSFRDENPPLNTPLFYRLKMMDTDGSFKYSPMRQTMIKRRSFEAFIAPNPALEQGKLFVNAQQEQVFRILVVNTLGQTVYRQEIFAEKGERNFQLPELASGLYTVQLQGEAEQQTLQFLKK